MISNDLRYNIIAALIGALVSFVGSLTAFYAKVETHEARLINLEKISDEIRQDVKFILHKVGG